MAAHSRQGGDFVTHTGAGGESIYGKKFKAGLEIKCCRPYVKLGYEGILDGDFLNPGGTSKIQICLWT